MPGRRHTVAGQASQGEGEGAKAGSSCLTFVTSFPSLGYSNLCHIISSTDSVHSRALEAGISAQRDFNKAPLYALRSLTENLADLVECSQGRRKGDRTHGVSNSPVISLQKNFAKGDVAFETEGIGMRACRCLDGITGNAKRGRTSVPGPFGGRGSCLLCSIPSLALVSQRIKDSYTL